MITDDLRERALAFRQILLWGDIEDELAYEFIYEFTYLVSVSKQDIVLIINSHGGDLQSASAIIDEINAAQSSGIKIWTIATGVAHSAAAFILSQGSKGCRYARPHSTIMLHPCSLGLEIDYEGNQKILMDFLTKRTESMTRKVACACGKGKKYKQFLNDIDKGLWLTASDAVNYGVIDGVWSKPLPIGGFNGEQEEKCD